MLLVQKERIIEQLYNSNIVITSLEEDKMAVTNLMNELNIVGLSYVFLSKNQKVEKDYWYWKTSEENLTKASCLIIVLSKLFFDEKNAERRESFWYEVGIMEARGQIVIPYFYDIARTDWDKYLNITPIRQKQATNNVEELIAQIEQIRVFKKSFFKDRTIALYGNSRIFYSKLTVLFSIKREVIDSILARLQMLEDGEIQTRSDVLNLLHKEINFGIRLNKFGRKSFVDHPYYFAYLPEATPLNIDCAVINIANRFSVLSQNINNASCEVKVDFLLPNHEVLGASIKPYLEIDKNSAIRKGDLLKLLKYDVGENIYDNKLDVAVNSTSKTERIYFNLYFDDDNLIVNCDESELGKTCNYIYAK